MRTGLVILSFLFVCAANAQRKILFIGNSLTSYNNMPQMLQQMINEKKVGIKIAQCTINGMTLTAHAKNGHTSAFYIDQQEKLPSATKKIMADNWESIVLQEGTVTMLIPQYRQYHSEPTFTFFDSIIKSIGARTILFQNYTQKMYPERYCNSTGPRGTVFWHMAFDPSTRVDIPQVICSDSFDNSTAEFNVIEQLYNKLAIKLHAEIAPVGYYFEQCKAQYPEIDLYENSDNVHPSKEGAYLSACVFFKLLTKCSVKTLTYKSKLDSRTASKIRSLFDSNN